MAPPSEFDLRAALRDGAGDGVDASRLIMIGEAYRNQRAQRRARLLSAAAVIAVVTGGAVGLSRLGGGSEPAGSNSAAGGAAESVDWAAAGGNAHRRADSAYGALSGAGGPGAPAPSTPLAVQKAAAISCPTAVPDYPTAGGRTSTASSHFFDRPVASVVVCGYGPSTHRAGASQRQPGRLTLTGVDALVLARSIERAAVARTLDCGVVPPTVHRFAVIGVASSGHRAGPIVSAELGCDGITTNGTVVRYNWSPPPELGRRLLALKPSEPTAAAPSPSR